MTYIPEYFRAILAKRSTHLGQTAEDRLVELAGQIPLSRAVEDYRYGSTSIEVLACVARLSAEHGHKDFWFSHEASVKASIAADEISAARLAAAMVPDSDSQWTLTDD
jgi:hypothetical protein